jgi:hypothetical protein
MPCPRTQNIPLFEKTPRKLKGEDFTTLPFEENTGKSSKGRVDPPL